MNIQEWINNSKTIKKSKKSYAHFDNRIDITKMASYIQNPKNIAKHGFYPFIHYTMEMRKYNKKTGKKIKKREICYASHKDRCIYQFYSYLLNEYYNERLKKDGIAHVVVAYRTDLKDSNIQSAKKAFDFIRKNPKCYVMIGDFTNFFDNLDHQYLKKQWCSVLNVQKLPEDHYTVYKNVTRYSKWELEDLFQLNGLEKSDASWRALNEKRVVLSKAQYEKNRDHIIKNESSFGIPQGSSISGLLANIYMLEADKKIYEEVIKYNGFYMRYSDDFMIVLPEDTCNKKNPFKEFIEIIRGVPNLQLENKKTQFFEVDLPQILNVGMRFSKEADVSQKKINFLGFSFDGDKISLRPKTVGKYYYRMIRKAKAIAANRNHVGANHLYMRYSERGATGKKGNFFTYVNNAEKEFGNEEAIRKDVKNHMRKIGRIIKSEKHL